MFGVNSKSYSTFINRITLHIGPCSCKEVHSNNTCINSKHTYSPIWQDHGNPSPFPSTCWGWSPCFCWWFSSQDGGYFKSKNIYLCFGSFTTSFFWCLFGYGVWTFTKLFYSKWFYEWFQPLFQSMWAHCLRLSSTFSNAFFFYISTLSVREVVWKLTSHQD